MSILLKGIRHLSHYYHQPNLRKRFSFLIFWLFGLQEILVVCLVLEPVCDSHSWFLAFWDCKVFGFFGFLVGIRWFVILIDFWPSGIAFNSGVCLVLGRFDSLILGFWLSGFAGIALEWFVVL